MPPMVRGTVGSKCIGSNFEGKSLTRCPDPSTLAVPTALRTYLPQGRIFLAALPGYRQVTPSEAYARPKTVSLGAV